MWAAVHIPQPVNFTPTPPDFGRRFSFLIAASGSLLEILTTADYCVSVPTESDDVDKDAMP